MNPAEAEAAFINAARYAKSDYPPEAAVAFMCAGQAAFVQSKTTEALAYTQLVELVVPQRRVEEVRRVVAAMFAAPDPEKPEERRPVRSRDRPST